MYIIIVYHQNLSKIYHSHLKAYFDSNVKHITCYLNLLTSYALRANTFFPSPQKYCALKEEYQIRRNVWMRPLENFGI